MRIFSFGLLVDWDVWIGVFPEGKEVLIRSKRIEIGVIAEEVGQVVPEVVSYEANGKDARGVDYSRLTALLIEAVKQQQRQIRQQQSMLRTQSSAIERLQVEVRETRESLRKAKAQQATTPITLVAAK